MDDPTPQDPDSALAELDRIKSGLSHVLDALSEEEMEALMVEAEAFLAGVEFELETEAARPPWSKLHPEPSQAEPPGKAEDA